MYSVREFAELKGISRQRVLDLIRYGQIEAKKVGSQYVVDFSARSWEPRKTRPLSTRMSRALLSVLSGASVEGLASAEKIRLREHLAELRDSDNPSVVLDQKTWNRARLKRFRISSRDERLVPSRFGLEPAGLTHSSSRMSAGDVAEYYVSDQELSVIKRRVPMSERHDGNILFHVGDGPSGNSLGWVAADLGHWGGSREVREGDRLVRECLEGAEIWVP